MARFFVEPGAIVADVVTLVGADAHHAATVLRLAPGSVATALDGGGRVLTCRVEAVEKGRVSLRIEAEAWAVPPPVAVTLYQGLPKGDKLEWVVQKATELGVARIVPLVAARSVVKLEPAKAAQRRVRWHAIAREAAEQSERAQVPEVAEPVKPSAVRLRPHEQAYVLAEREDGLTLPRALPRQAPAAIGLFVGPEGGWTPEELAALVALGATPVSLGPRMLRTETAGLAAIAIVQAAYELGGFGGSESGAGQL